MTAPAGWDKPFDDPIPMPKGKPIRTPRHAADYIQTLPAKETRKRHWQLAVECLIDAAEGRGFPLVARAAVYKALHHDDPPAEPEPPRKKPVKRYRVTR